MHRMKDIAGVLLLVMLAGCASRVDAPAQPPSAVSMAPPLAARETGVVWLLPSCPRADREDRAAQVSGPAAAAAAALVPVGVDFLVSAVSDYLKRLETERTANWLATGAAELQQGYGCIVIARGHIGSRAVENLQQQGFLSPSDMRIAGLVAPPAFYMEIRVEVSTAPAAARSSPVTQIRLRPQVVQFARTAARRGTDEAKEIGVVLALRASPLPSRPTEATAGQGADAVFAFNVGALRPGQEIAPRPFPVPRVGERATQQEMAQHPFADLVQGGTLQHAGDQLNLAAFVTETGEPGRVLTLINETMERQSAGVRDGLTKALQDAVRQALTPAAGTSR
jgi:hypothetical protein